MKRRKNVSRSSAYRRFKKFGWQPRHWEGPFNSPYFASFRKGNKAISFYEVPEGGKWIGMISHDDWDRGREQIMYHHDPSGLFPSWGHAVIWISTKGDHWLRDVPPPRNNRRRNYSAMSLTAWKKEVRKKVKAKGGSIDDAFLHHLYDQGISPSEAARRWLSNPAKRRRNSGHVECHTPGCERLEGHRGQHRKRRSHLRRNEGAYSPLTIALYRGGHAHSLVEADRLRRKMKKDGHTSREIRWFAEHG